MKDLVPPEYVIDLRAFQYEYFVVGNMIFLLFADAYQYARVTGTPYKTRYVGGKKR